MKVMNLFRRSVCMILLLAMLIGYVPQSILLAWATEDPSTEGGMDVSTMSTTAQSGGTLAEDVSLIPTWKTSPARYYRLYDNPYNTWTDSSTSTKYEYPYMASMTIVGNYAYLIRTQSSRQDDTDINGNLSVFNISTQTHARLKIESSYNSTLLGSGKTMDGATVNGTDYLLVATGVNKAGPLRLFKVTKRSGGIPESVTKQGDYTITNSDGVKLNIDRITVLSVSRNTMKILFREDWVFYTATIDVTSGDTTIKGTTAFTLSSGLTEGTAKHTAKTIAGIPMSYATDSKNENIGKFNMLGMEAYEDRLYISVHTGYSNVILVYTNLQKMITGEGSLQPKSELCILASTMGYEIYQIQELAMAKGVLYYCSRQRRISATTYRGDLCHFISSTSARYDIQEGFRDMDAYALHGADTDHFVMINQSGVLKIVDQTKTTFTNRVNAFGLESDGKGYWYIRSLAIEDDKPSLKYITLTTDAYDTEGNYKVTLENKPETGINDYQLWSIRYDGLNNDKKKKWLYRTRPTVCI